MIRALLEGCKTQTRRIVKPQPEGANLSSNLNGDWLRKPFGELPLPKIEEAQE